MANTLCHRLCVGCLFLCALFGLVARAQDNTLSLSVGYRQMQETLNQSFIFRGPSLSLSYRRTVFSDTIVHIDYSTDLSFSGMFSHRMPAYSLSFRPVDFACTCPVYASPAWELRLGGSVLGVLRLAHLSGAACFPTVRLWRIYIGIPGRCLIPHAKTSFQPLVVQFPARIYLIDRHLRRLVLLLPFP